MGNVRKLRPTTARIIGVAGLVILAWLVTEWMQLSQSFSAFKRAVNSIAQSESVIWIPYYSGVTAHVFESLFGFAGGSKQYEAKGEIAKRFFAVFSQGNDFGARFSREQVKDTNYKVEGYLLLKKDGVTRAYRISLAGNSDPIDVSIFKLPTLEAAIDYVKLNGDEFCSMVKRTRND